MVALARPKPTAEELFSRNRGLVGMVLEKRTSLVNAMRSVGMVREDIEAEALYGLYLAASSPTFNPQLSAFSTYAVRCIGWQMSRALNQWAGHSGTARREALLRRQMLDTSLTASTCRDNTAEATDSQLFAAEVIGGGLDLLTPADQFIIRSRYAINGHVYRTYRDLGQILGLSKARIQQREIAALAVLRTHLTDIGYDMEKV